MLWKMGHSISKISQMERQKIQEKLLAILVDEPDFEWLIIDANQCKVPPDAAGARGGNQTVAAFG